MQYIYFKLILVKQQSLSAAIVTKCYSSTVQPLARNNYFFPNGHRLFFIVFFFVCIYIQKE